VFIVDVALEHVCGEFRSQADDGQITAFERDLLIDGAILLAAKVEELTQDGRAAVPPRQDRQDPHARHARQPAAAVRSRQPA